MIDWAEVFAHDTPLLEIIVRGTVVYWRLFFILRFVLKRGEGSVGLSDMLMVVLLGGAIENAMAGDHETLTDGALLVLTLAGWNYGMDWAAFHSSMLNRVFEPPKVRLIKNGRIQYGNMRSHLISRQDLMSQLRFNDISDITTVKAAYLEPNGEISVLTKDDESDTRDDGETSKSDT